MRVLKPTGKGSSHCGALVNNCRNCAYHYKKIDTDRGDNKCPKCETERGRCKIIITQTKKCRHHGGGHVNKGTKSGRPPKSLLEAVDNKASLYGKIPALTEMMAKLKGSTELTSLIEENKVSIAMLHKSLENLDDGSVDWLNKNINEAHKTLNKPISKGFDKDSKEDQARYVNDVLVASRETLGILRSAMSVSAKQVSARNETARWMGVRQRMADSQVKNEAIAGLTYSIEEHMRSMVEIFYWVIDVIAMNDDKKSRLNMLRKYREKYKNLTGVEAFPRQESPVEH